MAKYGAFGNATELRGVTFTRHPLYTSAQAGRNHEGSGIQNSGTSIIH
jgi:hypothetical protein